MNDVKLKYKSMGSWRARKIEKGLRGKSEKTKYGGFYIAIPPETGWPGGDPVNNGYRFKGK